MPAATAIHRRFLGVKLSVIIVNYNVKHYVEQCVDSVWRAAKGMDCEVFVVDNHSQDGSVDYLRQHVKGIKLIDSNHNLGFSRGNNIAIRQSVGEYVLLLNPDTLIGEDCLRRAVDFMDDHPKAGGVGVEMHNPNGSLAMESRRAVPSPLVSMKKMMGRDRHYYMSHLPWDSPARIEVISGAFCLVRRKALDEVGMLDEDYFMYGEDIDLSYRLLRAGWENWYLPLPIVHYKGESTQKSSFRYVHVFYEAMHIFFRKHYGHLSPFVTLPIRAAIYVKAAIALCGMLTERTRRAMGFVDFNRIQPDYLFVGTSGMVETTKRLALRKGLRASFHAVDAQNTNLEEAIETCQPGKGTVVVCDTEAFSYADIIQAFASRPQHELIMGTYSTHTRVIITPSEIIE